jgi:hypothetical protein
MNLASVAEFDCHGRSATLAKPKMLNGMSLDAESSHRLFGRWRTFSTGVGEIYAEQATLTKVLEAFGTMRIKTL